MKQKIAFSFFFIAWIYGQLEIVLPNKNVAKLNDKKTILIELNNFIEICQDKDIIKSFTIYNKKYYINIETKQIISNINIIIKFENLKNGDSYFSYEKDNDPIVGYQVHLNEVYPFSFFYKIKVTIPSLEKIDPTKPVNLIIDSFTINYQESNNIENLIWDVSIPATSTFIDKYEISKEKYWKLVDPKLVDLKQKPTDPLKPFRGTWSEIKKKFTTNRRLPNETEWMTFYNKHFKELTKNPRIIAAQKEEPLIEKWDDYIKSSEGSDPKPVLTEKELDLRMDTLKNFLLKEKEKIQGAPATPLDIPYDMMGNVSECIELKNSVIVARISNELISFLEPNFEIIKVESKEFQGIEDFWKKIKELYKTSSKPSLELTIKRTPNSAEESVPIIRTVVLDEKKLLVTDRILKGGSCIDPLSMLTPQARTLVVYGEKLNLFYEDYEKGQKNIDDLLKIYMPTDEKENEKENEKEKKLKNEGFAIIVMDELLENLQKYITNEDKKELMQLLSLKLEEEYLKSLNNGKFPKFSESDEKIFKENVEKLPENYSDQIKIAPKQQESSEWQFELKSKHFLFKKEEQRLNIYEFIKYRLYPTGIREIYTFTHE